MSFAVKNVSPSDGRLAPKRALTEAFRWLTTGANLPVMRDGRLVLLSSAAEAARIRKKNQLLSNANDAISLLQVADDALDATTEALQEMRSLAMHSLDPTDPIHGRLEVLSEKLDITAKIWQILNNAKFNNQSLLNGGVTQQAYSVGDNPDQVIPVTIGNVGTVVLALKEELGALLAKRQGNGRETAAQQMAVIDSTIETVVQIRTALGPLHSRFEEAVARLHQATSNTAKVAARDDDEGFAVETVTFTRDVIFRQRERSLLIQANQQPQIAMQLLDPE